MYLGSTLSYWGTGVTQVLGGLGISGGPWGGSRMKHLGLGGPLTGNSNDHFGVPPKPYTLHSKPQDPKTTRHV